MRHVAPAIVVLAAIGAGCLGGGCGADIVGLRGESVVAAEVSQANRTFSERLQENGFVVTPLPGGFDGVARGTLGNLTVTVREAGHFASRQDLTSGRAGRSCVMRCSCHLSTAPMRRWWRT